MKNLVNAAPAIPYISILSSTVTTYLAMALMRVASLWSLQVRALVALRFQGGVYFRSYGCSEVWRFLAVFGGCGAMFGLVLFK